MSVTWGDIDNTPADHVYVEAHTFTHDSQKSFVLKSWLRGTYEASLPQGVYDVFVSDGVSMPASKRVLVQAQTTTSWKLKLENDDIYLEK